MGKIYNLAQTVLVWLDPASAISNRVFDWCAEYFDGTEHVNLTSFDDIKRKPEGIKVNINSFEVWAINAIYRRSYWTRLWIVQKLCSAKDITFFCGAKSLPWSIFRRLPRATMDDISQDAYTEMKPALDSMPAGRYARDLLEELNKKELSKHRVLNLDELLVKFG
jgi:hypothetical protein